MRRNVQARDGGGGCVTIHRCLGDSGRRFGTTAAFTGADCARAADMATEGRQRPHRRLGTQRMGGGGLMANQARYGGFNVHNRRVNTAACNLRCVWLKWRQHAAEKAHRNAERRKGQPQVCRWGSAPQAGPHAGPTRRRGVQNRCHHAPAQVAAAKMAVKRRISVALAGGLVLWATPGSGAKTVLICSI